MTTTQEQAPFSLHDTVIPHPLYKNPATNWKYGFVIGIHWYPQVDGHWVIDIQHMRVDSEGFLALIPVRTFMLAAWEVQLYPALTTLKEENA